MSCPGLGFELGQPAPKSGLPAVTSERALTESASSLLHLSLALLQALLALLPD